MAVVRHCRREGGFGAVELACTNVTSRRKKCRALLSFVHDNNIPSLKGCQRSGFAPHLLHDFVRLGFGFARRDSFVDLPADDPLRTKQF